MKRTLLTVLCVVTAARAQFGITGAIDTDWLMDDPHKTDRLPIWNRLLGNRGFGFGARATANQSPVSFLNRRWNNNPSGNSGNSWTQTPQTLQNLYRIILWRNILNNNQNNMSKAPSTAEPLVTNASSRNTDQNWKNTLQNFYRAAMLSRLFSNQRGSNSNAA